MALSWNEIKRRSIDFSNKWSDESCEHAEAKSFWDAFFHIFGIERRRIASFEKPVRKLNDNYGFIDLFWKGTLLVEHKSRGKNLDKAYTQALFAEYRLPYKNFILIPLTTSENRKYIPMEFFNTNCVINNTSSIIPSSTVFHFGILTSLMHMTWMKHVCGRLKSDYRYSNKLVYNNYPWPLNPKELQMKLIEEKAQEVLDTRTLFPDSSLADLYDPLTMPPKLVNAHKELDKAVDYCYRDTPFTTEVERLAFLFDLYNKYVKNKND